MESACSVDDAHHVVSYGWIRQPLGFQCTYDHATTSTSLWF